jgi:acetoin utilization deacetylase AcuC-like enzyme
LRDHRPELLLISSGFDAHVRDPMSEMLLESQDFGTLTAWSQSLANELCNGRLAIALEGGYALEALEPSVLYTLKALQGRHDYSLAGSARPEVSELLFRLRAKYGV